MAAPTKLGSACYGEASFKTSHPVTLPSWLDGDLAVIFFTNTVPTATASPPTGWTDAGNDSHTGIGGAMFWRVMQTGDTDPPVVTTASSTTASAISVVIDAGTFDAADPIDVATTTGAWNVGSSATPTASAVTTNNADSLAFSFGALDGAQTPYGVNTAGWTETHASDCGVYNCGALVAEKVIASASSTGAVEFSMNASDTWTCAIIAINAAAATSTDVAVPLATYTVAGLVPTIETGVAVEVPLATYTVAGLVPTVVAAQGAAVEVPLATYTVAGLVPAVAAGASVEVPLATYTVAGLVPTIDVGGAVTVDVPLATYTVAGLVPAVAAGVAVAVPLATYTVAGLVPAVAAGVAVAVPLATYTVAGLVPSVQAAAVTTVEVPVATYTVAGLVPTVAAGAAVAVPLATYTFTASIPMITAGITAFPSMTIETDDDRLGVMTHDNVTLVHSGVPYLAIAAETDGLTLDSGTDTDGMIEVQINTSAVAAGNIQEHETVSIGGVAYTIGKIDTIGGGMSVMYLIP